MVVYSNWAFHSQMVLWLWDCAIKLWPYHTCLLISKYCIPSPHPNCFLLPLNSGKSSASVHLLNSSHMGSPFSRYQVWCRMHGMCKGMSHWGWATAVGALCHMQAQWLAHDMPPLSEFTWYSFQARYVCLWWCGMLNIPWGTLYLSSTVIEELNNFMV